MRDNGVDSFRIENNKSVYIEDYRIYYNKMLKKVIFKNIGGLLLSVLNFLLITTYSDTIVIESISFGIMIFFLITSGVRIYDLNNFKRKLNIHAAKLKFYPITLTIEPTFINVNQGNQKNVIFISQIKKCIIISDILFIIEKNNEFSPWKVNKKEMSMGSFKKLIDKFKKIPIHIE